MILDMSAFGLASRLWEFRHAGLAIVPSALLMQRTAFGGVLLQAVIFEPILAGSRLQMVFTRVGKFVWMIRRRRVSLRRMTMRGREIVRDNTG